MKYILLLLISGCATPSPWVKYAQIPDGGLERFENQEVVCYSLSKNSDYATLQCKFKK